MYSDYEDLMKMKNFTEITTRKLKIAVVGCGRISKNHLGSIIQQEQDFDLISVCDNDPAAMAAAVTEYKVRGYQDLGEMLRSESLDLVVLCTPSGLHSKQAILASEFGVHVVCEKPMATKYQDGIAMVKACDDASVRLFVVKQNRHNATLQLLKRAVTEKRFGQIKMVHVNVFWTRPQDYYDQGNGWRGTWEFDGGAFMNQASHYVDLLEWLIGPVETVQAMMSTTRDMEVEDTGVMNIKWRNGALGSMAVTMLTYPKNLEGSITILGDNGSVKVGGVAVNEIQTWEFGDKCEYDAGIKNANYKATSVYGVGHSAYYKNIVGVMRGKESPETDGRAGLKSLELLTAAYIAARDGKSIGLPLNF